MHSKTDSPTCHHSANALNRHIHQRLLSFVTMLHKAGFNGPTSFKHMARCTFLCQLFTGLNISRGQQCHIGSGPVSRAALTTQCLCFCNVGSISQPSGTKIWAIAFGHNQQSSTKTCKRLMSAIHPCVIPDTGPVIIGISPGGPFCLCLNATTLTVAVRWTDHITQICSLSTNSGVIMIFSLFFCADAKFVMIANIMPNKHAKIIIIPARMAASRLPNKPLADIAGKPIRCLGTGDGGRFSAGLCCDR